MNVAAIMPYRSNGPERDAAWLYVRGGWEDAAVYCVDDGGDPFSRAASINLGIAARPADVYVITDADMIVDSAQIHDAIEQAAETPGIVVAFDRYCYLTQTGTQAILAGHDGPWEPFVQFTYEKSVGGVLAISRHTWDLVGGFDPRFRGWGMEDTAFEIACRTLAGPTRKIPGTAYHLWHPLEPCRPAENVELLHRYQLADGNPDALRALTRRADVTP